MWPFKPKRVQIQLLPSTELNIETWQSSKELVGDMQKMRLSPVFRAMVECLRNESPSNYGLPMTGVSIDDRIAKACRDEGYHMALNNIEALARFKPRHGELEATFEPDSGYPGVQGKVE